MKNVFICSPLGGRRACAPDFAANLENAKRYTKYALECGAAPVVPHFYAEILDDNDPEQRSLGMRAGLSLIWNCDECWVFGERITEGMSKEIRFAQKLNITIRRFSDDMEIKFLIKKFNDPKFLKYDVVQANNQA